MWPFTKKSKAHEIDFEKVLILYKELHTGNYSNYLSRKYGDLISDAAMQAIQENQLNKIANRINLAAKLELELGNHKKVLELIMDELSGAYNELDADAKYELVPLFLNVKDQNTSYYFHDTDVQTWTRNTYDVLLKKDGLTFDTVESEYYKYTPLAEKYPYVFGDLLIFIEAQKS